MLLDHSAYLQYFTWRQFPHVLRKGQMKSIWYFFTWTLVPTGPVPGSVACDRSIFGSSGRFSILSSGHTVSSRQQRCCQVSFPSALHWWSHGSSWSHWNSSWARRSWESHWNLNILISSRLFLAGDFSLKLVCQNLSNDGGLDPWSLEGPFGVWEVGKSCQKLCCW